MKASKPNAVDRHVGSTLRQHREAQSISLEAMAAYLGVTLADVEAFEAGTARISVAHLYAVTEMLGLDLKALYTRLVKDCDTHVALNAAADAKFFRDYLALTRGRKNDMQAYLQDLKLS